ncbi:hypothetical protein D9M72_473690 [compost metagenome]
MATQMATVIKVGSRVSNSMKNGKLQIAAPMEPVRKIPRRPYRSERDAATGMIRIWMADAISTPWSAIDLWTPKLVVT